MSDGTQTRLEFAHLLADAAGAAILPYFRKRTDVSDKGAAKGQAFDPVTAADQGAETAMRDLITKNFPQDGILGEEFGAVAGTNGFRWVLDPLDGTRAFITGSPLWGTLIALEEKGTPVVGIIDQPFLRERFIGTAAATELRDASGTRPLRVRACEALSDAVVGTTHPQAHFNEAERAAFRRVETQARLSRYGGDCYLYAQLAMGFVDLVIEANLSPWDVAALIPVVQGAGGIVSDWSGQVLAGAQTNGTVSVIVAGDKRVHAQALKLLSA